MKTLRPSLLALTYAIWYTVTPTYRSVVNASTLDLIPNKLPQPSLHQQPTAQKEQQKPGALISFMCGSASGLFSRIVQHPFDTIKVLLQTQDQRLSIYQCLRHLIEQEGFQGLYKGMSAPLVGSVVKNALVLYTYDQIKSSLDRLSNARANNGGRKLTTEELCVAAGAIGGAFTSFVLTPVEFIKCRIQVQPSSDGKSPRQGPTAIIRDLYRSNDPLTKLYTGHTMTLARETVGGGAWFGVYEAWREAVRRRTGRREISPVAIVTGGSLAGMAYSIILYPADVVKTRMQTEGILLSSTPLGAHKASGFAKIVKDLYRAQGLRGFYSGLSLALLKSVPASAATLLSYVSASSSIPGFADICLIGTDAQVLRRQAG